MTGVNRVIAIGPGGHEAASEEFLLTDEVVPVTAAEVEPWVHEPAEQPAEHSGTSALLPAIGIGLVAAWTAAFVWSKVGYTSALPTFTQGVGWIGEWAMPAALIGILWLLTLRSSRRETDRFGQAARLLSEEAARLEASLSSVNSELSLAREFIAAQSRDLDALGRVATERLSQHADRLHGLIHENTAQIDAIGTVSGAALDNMEKLRGQLPVIANSARDVTNNIGNAGRTAHAQLQELIGGFKRLNEFGQASERQVESLRDLVGTTLEGLLSQTEQLETLAAQRFAAITEQGTALRGEIDASEVQALAALRDRTAALAAEIELSRGRIDAQEEKGLAALGGRVQALREHCDQVSRTVQVRETEAVAALQDRFTRIDDEIAVRRQHQIEQAEMLSAHGATLGSQMDALGQRIGELAEHASSTEAKLAESAQSLAGRLTESREILAGTDSEIAALTEASVRLLELIHAGSQHTREKLPAALAEAETRLESVEGRMNSLRHAASNFAGMGTHFHEQLVASHDRIARAASDLDALHQQLGASASNHGEEVARLREALEAVQAQSDTLATKAQAELGLAIDKLVQSAGDAVAGIEARSAAAIAGIAERIGKESQATIDRVLAEQTGQVAGQLEQQAAQAAEVSRAATVQLRDQLAKVNELAGNLERRVAHAREKAEEQVDNDFSRRVAVITEALNSNAIDIARALDTEVSDVAWAAYLKGDRGIFTRRAVNLLEAGEAKQIVQVYEGDRQFREQVNRYIHDFEAMLRQILSTRDGHALGVTVLSSDMGKLYVALAQAIERLRN